MTIRSSNREPITHEDINRDIAIRRNLEQVFGIASGEDEGESGARSPTRNGAGDVRHSNPIPDQQTLHDARLARDLRAAGLI